MGLQQQRNPIRYEAILLDVDNGPSEWCLESNRGLYDHHGLELIRDCLVPEGVLAVWSAYADPRFLKALQKSGYRARSQMVRGHGRKGPRHTVFLARKRPRS